jgi:hypothetical protein
MDTKTAKLTVGVSTFNNLLDELGLQFAGFVFDPSVKRTDGKLEMSQIQNVPDARADVLLEAFAFVRNNPDSYKVEEFHHIAGPSTVQ